ncbi:MAG: hypothetical protein JWR63_3029 [Conexibacter sp.]|nr:hypothetical protein [Conexibacter sp.]
MPVADRSQPHRVLAHGVPLGIVASAIEMTVGAGFQTVRRQSEDRSFWPKFEKTLVPEPAHLPWAEICSLARRLRIDRTRMKGLKRRRV